MSGDKMYSVNRTILVQKNHIIKDSQGRFIFLQQYDLWDIKSVGECKESDDLLLKRIHIYWWFSETFVSKDVKCLILIPVHKALPYLPRINVNVCNISRSINFNWKPTKKTFTIMAKPICNLLLSIRSSQLHYHTCDFEDDDEYIHTDVVIYWWWWWRWWWWWWWCTYFYF